MRRIIYQSPYAASSSSSSPQLSACPLSPTRSGWARWAIASAVTTTRRTSERDGISYIASRSVLSRMARRPRAPGRCWGARGAAGGRAGASVGLLVRLAFPVALEAFGNPVGQAVERAAADEEDVRRVELQEILVGM